MNEPPLITISDPNRPGEPVDVLGGVEREPWRPTRRQVVVLLVVLAVAAATVVPTLLWRQHQAQQAADRRSVAQVSLVSPPDNDAGFAGGFVGNDLVALVVKNTGPATVRVVSARIDRTGYGRQRIDLSIPAGSSATLHLEPEPGCPTTVPHRGPTGVLVDVVTNRGQRTTARLDTSATTFADAYLQAVKDHCHLFDVVESLSAAPTASVRHGRLSLSLQLSNQSAAARTVRSLKPPPGFAFHPDAGELPLLVPGFPQAADPLTGTITVTSCALATPYLATTPDGIPVQVDPGTGVTLQSFGGGSFAYPDPSTLTAQVSGDGRTASVELFFADDFATPMRQLVSQACRG